MITEKEESIIREGAEKYGTTAVFLFGSSLEHDDYRDIDLAVDGLEPGKFFSFYAYLVKRLSKQVDLVDLSHRSLFSDLVVETGTRVYG